MIYENIEILLSAEKIAARVKELAAQITRDYAGEGIVLLGTLKGAAIFLSDIAREIDLPIEIEFLKASSYGDKSESSGEVRFEYLPEIDFRGKNIILVEDIVDMGYTANRLREFLLQKNAASVKLCALLDKPERRKVSVEIEYLGFSIPDEFVVGYGLDYAQRYRNLPFVGILKL
ncbi:MAG: hypoxanthine phosphoribosyltransferase [Clostridiales bacterium]|jgi:hypoxanthine phosphoribosyltransferase|nr:hypoxanthine phosphoribosyltransferase [Clostridiales bacterium]